MIQIHICMVSRDLTVEPVSGQSTARSPTADIRHQDSVKRMKHAGE